MDMSRTYNGAVTTKDATKLTSGTIYSGSKGDEISNYSYDYGLKNEPR